LPAGTSTSTTELLRLHPSGVSNEEGTVIGNQLPLEFHGTESIDIFGIVCHNGLGNGLADGIDLRGVASTFDANTDIDGFESVRTGDKDGLVDLESQDFRTDELNGRAVDAEEATALLGVSDSSRGLSPKRTGILIKLCTIFLDFVDNL
jgi:hypothetical protein